MPKCRFFMQGYCRFGDSCRFEHADSFQQSHYEGYSPRAPRSNQYNYQPNSNQYKYQASSRDYQQNNGGDRWNSGGDRWNSGGDSFNRESRGYYGNDRQSQKGSADTYGDRHKYQASSPPPARSANPSDQDGLPPDEILAYVSDDIAAWDACKIWPFSCYGFTKHVKSFPGLEDLSFEEIRLLAYEANLSGDVNTFLSSMAELNRSYELKRMEIVRPDPRQKLALLDVIKEFTTLAAKEDVTTSFQPHHSSAFGFNSNQPFGAAPVAFGSPLTAPAFDSSVAAGGFRTQPTQANSLSNASNQNQSGFGAFSFVSPIGAPTSATSSFGAPAAGVNAFGTPVSGSTIFGAPVSGSSSFGSQFNPNSNNQTSTQKTSTPELASLRPTDSHVTMPSRPTLAATSSPYTPMDFLSDGEKAQFAAPSFTMVPTNPPAMEYC